MNDKELQSCLICGSMNFECIDGFFYCGLCNSQSQTLREECHDDELTCTFTTLGKVHSEEAEFSTNKVLTKQLYYEALTEVYLAMITFMSKKVTDPKFSKLAVSIWTTYLRNLKVAFHDDCVPRTDVSATFCNSKSELSQYFADNEDLETSNFPGDSFGKTLKRLRRKSKDTTALHVDYDVHDAEMEEINDDCDRLENIDDGDVVDGLEDEINDDKKKNKEEFPRLNLNDLVSCIYLTLLLTVNKNESTSIELYDMIRWIREGYFPYRSARRWVETTNLSGIGIKELDHDDLCPPTHKTIREYTTKIMTLLNIKRLPPRDVMLVVERLVYCLQLPKEFINMAKLLLRLQDCTEKCDFVTRYQHSKGIPVFHPLEGRAMALIIVLLKLIFGLDDNSERYLSNYGVWLRNELKSKGLEEDSENVFVWSSWLQFLSFRHTIMRNLNPNFLATDSLCRCREDKNLTQVIDFINSQHVEIITRDKKNNRHHIEDMKNILQDEWESTCSYVDFGPSNNPEVDQFQHLVVNNPDYLSQLSEEVRQYLLERYYEKSLDFILCPPGYVDLLCKAGIKYNIQTQLPRKQVNASKVDLHPVRDLSSVQACIKILSIKTNPTSGPHPTKGGNEAPLQPMFVGEGTLFQPWRAYWIYIDEDSSEALLHSQRVLDYYAVRRKLPHTFCKILDICADIIEMSSFELLNCVINTELRVLDHLVTAECRQEFLQLRRKCHSDRSW